MAVSAIRKINEDLPHADIYLNDLWEIEELYRQTYLKAEGRGAVTFSYQVDDLVITSREELEAHGGRINNFTLELIESAPYLWSTSVLYVRGFINPSLRVPVGVRDFAWDLQGRVNAIFEARRKTYKNAVHSVPFLAGWMIAALMPYVSDLLIPARATKQVHLILTTALTVGYLGAYSYGLFSKNRIYFQKSRDDERARTARRNERVEKLLWLVAGVFFGIVGTLIINHFKH